MHKRPLMVKRGVVVAAMLTALVFVGTAAPSSPTPAVDEATAYQSNPAHDGHIADAGLSAPLQQAWSVTLPGGLYQASYPVIVDGVVYVTTARNRIYALNQATGAKVWSRQLGGTCCWAGLTYERGRIFAANGTGDLVALDAATGSTVWSTHVGTASFPPQYSFTSSPTAANGIVYTAGAGSGGTVYAVRETDGRLLWTQRVANGDHSSPAVSADGVVVSYSCQNVYDFDPLTGGLDWSFWPGNCSGGGGKTPVVAGGHVFIRDHDGNAVLSSATGLQQGTFTQGHSNVAPAIANGVAFMYEGTTLKSVSDSGLGTTNWTFTGDGHLNSAPLVAGNLVFVASSTGNLYALDASTGTQSWSTNVGTAIASPDEQNGVPLTGLGAANGTLVLSAGSSVVAYRSAGAIAEAPSNDAQPSIDGSVDLNEAKAADVGIWSGLPSAYAYQWEQCNSAGDNCADVPGATGASYVPGPEADGATLRVKVTATNSVGSSAPVESLASPVLGLATDAPDASTAPAVIGTAAVGAQLSTTNGTWTNSATSFAYQWQRCDEAATSCEDIPDATSAQYSPVADDIGYALRSEVLASNAIGPSPDGYAISPPTGLVDQPGAPRIPAATGDEANAFQQDPGHDGHIADAGLAAPLAQAWSLTLSGTVNNELIADGMVFVTTSDKILYALNQATGATVWSYAFGGWTSWSGLAYDRGRLFLVKEPSPGSSDVLSAVDAATGSVLWSQPVWPGQPAAMNGIVYTAGPTAMRESDGSIVWSSNTQTSPPAVTPQGVYVAYGCQKMGAFDPLLGTQLWYHEGPCGSGGAAGYPVAASGHVYSTELAFGNQILSASTGAVEGGFNQGPINGGQAVPAAADGVGFFLSDGSITAVDNAGIGSERWTFAGDGSLNVSPIVAGGLVFVGSSGGNVYGIDATTGAMTWSTNMGAAVPKSLAAANGTLVVAAGTQLVAYRTAGAITEVPSNQSLPTIHGPADLSGLEAVDVGVWSGLPSAYAYQWELCDSAGANCSDIAGATGLSYLPPAEDVGVGKTLRVRVVASNDVGASDPVESIPSATSPLVLGAAQAQSHQRPGHAVRAADVGQQLTTTNGIWTNDPTSYTYKWQRCDGAGRHCVDIPGATSPQYTLVAGDAGFEIRSEVRARNAAGPASFYAPSPPTSVIGGVARPTILAAPVVSGTAAVGQQLSTTTGTWGYNPTTYTYKWQRCDAVGSNCVDIAGATGSVYTAVSADAGYEIRSAVLASNATGQAIAYAVSMPTAPLGLPWPGLLRSPVVNGTPAVGQQLTTDKGEWTHSPTSYSYQWQRCDTNGANCVTIANATATHYTLVTADAGHEIRSGVLARNGSGPAAIGYAPSAPTAVVASVGKPAVITLPKISGTAKVGNSLAVSDGTWKNSPTGYTYRWLRCSATGTACKTIAGATSSSYLLKSADARHRLKARVTASNGIGSATATSKPSAKVAK
jgi:outer membrane protein assembly factor BamB